MVFLLHGAAVAALFISRTISGAFWVMLALSC
jgi:hypothetical protein